MHLFRNWVIKTLGAMVSSRLRQESVSLTLTGPVKTLFDLVDHVPVRSSCAVMVETSVATVRRQIPNERGMAVVILN